MPDENKTDSCTAKALGEALIKELLKSEKGRDCDAARCVELINAGADLNNSYGQKSEVPLTIALRHKKPELAELMLHKGVDVNVKGRRGNTPLIYAALHGYDHLVEAILEAGADIDARNDHMRTALMFAVEHGRHGTVELLVNRGADIELHDDEGFTPLMSATYEGYLNTVRFLVEKGADVEAVNDVGHTARDCARQSKETHSDQLQLYDEIMDFLETERLRRVEARFREAAGAGTSRPRKIIRRKLPVPSQCM
ncbi:MAG: ankyrin repeat domain-containing protein [Alphaproteobacteria bacterium]|nr:ankyrin repeat domain-containing protein [Alphaproteobacteria bacterium]